MIKSRRAYKCHECKEPINKGDLYARKTIRLGSSKPDTVENISGQATLISHGLSVSVKCCERCTNETSPHHPPRAFA